MSSDPVMSAVRWLGAARVLTRPLPGDRLLWARAVLNQGTGRCQLARQALWADPVRIAVPSILAAEAMEHLRWLALATLPPQATT